jgi:hypothetical protein
LQTTHPTVHCPRSTIRRRRRRAVTIVEVLFAILVATVGIFSVIVIFPFASSQARRARVNDMLANAGRSAFHNFDTRGLRRPDRWVAWDQRAGASGAFVPINLDRRRPPILPTNAQFAESFCIDPRMIAAHTTVVTPGNIQRLMPAVSATGGLGGQCVQTFPYTEPFTDANRDSMWNTGENFQDLNGNGVHDPPQWMSTLGPFFDSSLMRRITLRTAAGSNFCMTLAQANAIFMIDDDIAYQRNAGDKSLPANQDALLVSGGAPSPNRWLKRDSERKISWLATLVPRFDASLILDPTIVIDEYVLSVVMLYEQPADLGTLDMYKERVVDGQFEGTGATGGEIVLTSTSPEQLKLRANNWVMVSGTYQMTPAVFITRFQWYRVTECDAEPEFNGTAYVLNATLMGQDWNTAYANPPTTLGGLVGQVRVTIVEGAFAVYEKSIRLESGSSM